MDGLLGELRRRNVFRVGVAYLAAAWLLLQVIDVLIPILDLPQWTNRFILIVLLVGFFLALVFAWAFELTPESAPPEDPGAKKRSPVRKLDVAIIAMLAAAILYMALGDHLPSPGPDPGVEVERTIAVLPFRSRSSVAEDTYFVDGMHDDLLTKLSRINWFERVISRTSSERYRETDKTIRQIGEELGVAHILQGAVQRAGDRVRINVQLINAQTDDQVWAGEFDRKLNVNTLFETQSEISSEIVANLQGVLSDGAATILERKPTNSLEAYHQYTLGRRAFFERTGEALQRSRAHFREAVELDPDYELAWVGLADTLALLPGYAGLQPEEFWEERQQILNRALEINPLSGEAYTNLGYLRAEQGELEEAEQQFLRAIELNANYPLAHHFYSRLLLAEGRPEEAVIAARRALELDPAQPVFRQNLAEQLQLLGRMEESRAVLAEGLQKNQEFPGFHRAMAYLLKMEGQLARALISEERARALNPSSAQILGSICELHLALQDTSGAQRCSEEFEEQFPELPNAAAVAIAYVSGKDEEALTIAEVEFNKSNQLLFKIMLAQAYIATGRLNQARVIQEDLFPQFFADDEVTVDFTNLHAALDVAHLLYECGDLDRANGLFEAALSFLTTLHRTRGAPLGLLDVTIHAIRGDLEPGLESLQEAYDSGWRLTAWLLPQAPLNRFEGNSEWDHLVTLFLEDLERQRRWYKDQTQN